MLNEQAEALWLHEQYTFSLAQLSELSGMSEAQIYEMVEYGVIAPIDPKAKQWMFGADRLVTVRMARRLVRDFDLDSPGLALTLTLLDRIHTLEAEVNELRAKLPSSIRHD